MESLRVRELASFAKAASREMARLTADRKNEILHTIARAIRENGDRILEANRVDIDNAEKNGIRPAMIDRLKLTSKRIDEMAEGAIQVAKLADPVGEVISEAARPNKLVIRKVRAPLGVIGIIYESRPNVTLDAAVLCLKSGNSVVLRGGKEAINSNIAIAKLMREAIAACGVDPNAVCLVSDTSRDSATELMGLKGLIDVLIPRGGAGLIRSVVENARVPVIETGIGNCHLYIDEYADLGMAERITANAKCSRPSVCNAIETLLVHERVAEKFLPRAKSALDRFSVEWRGCEKTRDMLGDSVKPVTEEDYATEFNDFIIAVRVVSGLDEALSHIAKYSSMHSEGIVTGNNKNAERFLNEVDAAAVYLNASTRFTDGFEFGLGAEIGISTQKMHARGPMGLIELTSYKYVILGDGQIR